MKIEERICLMALATVLLISLSGCAPDTEAPAGSNSGKPVSSNAARIADEGALRDAARQGDVSAVKALLDRGVDVNAKDNEGRTPLSEAVFNERTEVTTVLLAKGADAFSMKSDGQTPFNLSRNHKEVADLIDQEIQLLDLARNGDTKALKEALDKGRYVNFKDSTGRTPLTEAIWNNHADAVKLLLERGADPKVRKVDGATALELARSKGNKEIIDLLVNAGAK